MNTNNSGELREITGDELQSVKGGSLADAIIRWTFMTLGYTPKETEEAKVSLSPSQTAVLGQ